MSLARYYVFQAGAEWLVALDGAAIGRHPTKDAALNSAIIMADLMGSMQHDSDVMLESDGRLAFAWTYGVDALPPMAGQQGEAA